MPSSRHDTDRVLALCLETLARPASERMVFLADACDGDFRLRASVEAVLVAVKDAQAFLRVGQIDRRDHADLIGDRLGDYHIEAFAGEGALGAVFRARRGDLAAAPPVALRLLRGHLLAREYIERFVSAATEIRAVRHPNIAGVLDAGVSGAGRPYLIYPWIDGTRLDEHCDRSQLALPARAALLEQVCLGLQRAHQHLVAGCGVSAANVLVTADGVPVLLDFASVSMVTARWPQGAASAFADPARALARDTCAPELLLHGRLTTAADVYALGVLASELLCGERPCRLDGQDRSQQAAMLDLAARIAPSARVRAETDWARRKAVAHRRGATPRRLASALEGDLDGIVLAALAFDPAGRPASAAAVAAALSAWRQRVQPGRRTGRLRRVAAAAVAAAALLLAAAAAF